MTIDNQSKNKAHKNHLGIYLVKSKENLADLKLVYIFCNNFKKNFERENEKGNWISCNVN